MGIKIDTTKLKDSEIYDLILKGDIKKFPDFFWTKPGAEDSAKEVTKHFIENILKWDDEKIRTELCEKTFRSHKLSGMLEYVFGRSPYKALDNAYPGKFLPWELDKCTPKNLWGEEENREKAIRWLLEKVKKDKFEELTNVDFLNNHLSGLMDYLHKQKVFNKVDVSKVEEGLNFNERVLNISFNKSGGTSSRNGVTTRITLPVSWVRELGATEEDRSVKASFKDGKIIIEKIKE